MGLAFVTDVLSSVQSGAMGTAKAKETFARLFGVMCWEFLDDRRKDALTAHADDVLQRLATHQIDYARAQREITRLVEAAVKRDYRLFDRLCMTAPVPEAADLRM